MQQREFTVLDMRSGLHLAAKFPARADEIMDDRLCHFAYGAMKEKLEVAREKGRGGWWDADRCSLEYLRSLLVEHVEKGDMVDVMNLAAMIYARECADA